MRRVLAVPAQQKHFPCELRARMIAVVLGDFDDVSIAVHGARIRLVHLPVRALRVVRQRHVHLPIHRIRFNVLRPVHLRRTQQRRGRARIHRHVRLIPEAVRRRQRALPVHQRQPLARAAVIEPRHIQHAFIQQPIVGRPIERVIRAVAHVLVDELEPLIVAHASRQPAVPRHLHRHAFVPEPPQRRALLRLRLRIVRIEFHHPSKTVRLVRVLGDVKTFDVARPRILPVPGRQPVTRVHRLQRSIRQRSGIGKILVEVLFSRQCRAPRRLAARAIVQRSDHESPRQILRCFKPRRTRRRTRQCHRRR